MFVAVVFVLRWGYVDALGGLPIVQFVGRWVAADLPLAVNRTPVGIAGHVEVTETAGQHVYSKICRTCIQNCAARLLILQTCTAGMVIRGGIVKWLHLQLI